MVDFYGFHVGKYTSPMDGLGTCQPKKESNLKSQKPSRGLTSPYPSRGSSESHRLKSAGTPNNGTPLW